MTRRTDPATACLHASALAAPRSAPSSANRARRALARLGAAAVLLACIVTTPSLAQDQAAGAPPAASQPAPTPVSSDPQPQPPGEPAPPPEPAETTRTLRAPGSQVKVTDMQIKGSIEGANITFTLDFVARSKAVNQQVALISGDVVLESITQPASGYKLRYDKDRGTYYMIWPNPGTYNVSATFAVRPAMVGADGQPILQEQPGDVGPQLWRESIFSVPASRVRQLEVTVDRTDLEVKFPGALRLERRIENEQLVITALLGPGRPFAVRWKPQVQVAEAKLVLSSHANTIATANVGALRLDTLFMFDIAQGKLEQLRFTLPPALSVTQVRGDNIRDWRIEAPAAAAPVPGAADAPPVVPAADAPPADPGANAPPPGAAVAPLPGAAFPGAGAAGGRTLVVVLNRPQRARYALQILGEMVLGQFPVQIDAPALVPAGGMRASGHLVIGTDSAIQLLVRQTSGLSQIDGAAFPRVILDRAHPRPLPRGKAFYYSYAGSPYQMQVGLDDIVPSFDAAHRLVIAVREDDLTVDATVELDVRDAPIRMATIEVPAGLVVAAAGGSEVEDYSVRLPDPAVAGAPQLVDVHFHQPVLGRTLIGLRLELGRGPLDVAQQITGLSVREAKSQRGYIVVVADKGVQLAEPVAQQLRQVNTASVPMRVADAQFAYRFREPAWTLGLNATKKQPGIRVEAFHLMSLGEGLAYGSVAVNYFITGSPVDELQFRLPDALQNVEFVGRDVRRWAQDPADPQLWTVTLSRKVIGDYNLGVTYTQHYEDGGNVLVGGVVADGVQTQTGYIVVASHLNVNLTPQAAADTALLEIDRQEIPANYRLLVNAPILRTYKYVALPHSLNLQVSAYSQLSLPAAVIEIMQLHSDVYVGDQGPSESVTRIRYKVKNATSQFLTLGMPLGARVWSTRVSDRDAQGNEVMTRVTSSHDAAKGVLMVPLKRNRNPNDPITVEVEYGQNHKPASTWQGLITLDAPTSEVRSTFDSWTVTVPREWAALAVDTDSAVTMIAQERSLTQGDLSLVAATVGQSWSQGFEDWAKSPAIMFAGIAALAVLVLMLILARRMVVDVLVLFVLGGLVWVGVQAAMSTPFGSGLSQPDDLRTLTFTQAVSLDDTAPLAVTASVVPQWRQHATVQAAVVIPSIALACLLLSLVLRRLRPLLAAAGVAGLVYGAGRFPHASLVLGHLFTWGLPALVAVWFIWRVMLRRRGVAWKPAPALVAATAALALAFTMLGGCATQQQANIPLLDQPILERVDAKLTAEKDSMAVDLDMRVSTSKPMKFAVLDLSSIMLTPEKTEGLVRTRAEDGRYVIEVRQAGTYDVALKFLTPLAPADEMQARQFRMPMPMALTNRVSLTIPATGLDVEVPTAVRINTQENQQATTVEAILGPGDVAAFAWRPRERQTKLEKTVFYSEVTSAVRFDAGLVEAHHLVQFQIAQGELSEIRVQIPDNMTVTAVEGEALGAWRFDPLTHELEAKLSQAASGEYQLRLVTQTSVEKTPYQVTIGSIRVIGAARQRGMIGLTTSPVVYVDVKKAPQSMNVDDFNRDAAAVLNAMQGARAPGSPGTPGAPARPGTPAEGGDAAASGVRFAYRIQALDETIQADVAEVLPEFRAVENAKFSVADERLAYNADLTVQIAKAGVFSIDLRLPANYDIDALSAPEVSHWDETVEGDVRTVQVHLRKRVLGQVPLKVTLSRPVSDLPQQITAPRIEVVGARKHTGQIVIESERGVRLSVVDRQGVSEVNPLELGIRVQGTLAFRLLRPDWALTLATEVVEPRVNVDFLHVATVTEGMVRHTHYLRYHLFNAGAKVFEVQVPDNVLGLLISGSQIARRQELEPGHWRIELAGKWYDGPYPLSISYETRFDRVAGQVDILPVQALGADLQRGHVVVMGNDRVELAARAVSASLQPAESRTISRQFGAGDLSAAAFSFSGTSADYSLGLTVTRHAAANLLEADVDQIVIRTVVTERGQSINRVQMQLHVGAKRHLETRLPPGGEVWSLLVNGRSTVPSKTTDPNGQSILLIPLDQAATGELLVNVDFVYVQPAPTGWKPDGHVYIGPKFDLPLKQINWTFYLPPQWDYDDFEGTLALNEDMVRQSVSCTYNLAVYEQQVQEFNLYNKKVAVRLQQQGINWQQQGNQAAAKQALEWANNYALNDVELNEDTRVQLHQLMRDNALIGLVNANDRLRKQSGDAPRLDQADQQAEQFSPEDAKRIKNSLSKADSENLERITDRIIQVQEAAAGPDVQLVINMPLRGRILEFNRPIQVKPNDEMQVRFTAKRVVRDTVKHGWYTAGGLFGCALVLFLVAPATTRRWDAVRRALAPASRSDGDIDGDNADADEVEADVDEVDDDDIAAPPYGEHDADDEPAGDSHGQSPHDDPGDAKT